MITDVTVAPTHRRRGLMRRLMTENLEAAVAADVPLAVLTASEGAIYQRFGFAPATREARLRVDTSARFRLRDRERDGGSVVMADPGDSWPPGHRQRAAHAVTRALGRPAYYGSAQATTGTSRARRKLRLAGGGAGTAPTATSRTPSRRPGTLRGQVHDFVSATATDTSTSGSSSPTSTSRRSSSARPPPSTPWPTRSSTTGCAG